jgi:hypothetical protein
MVVIFGGFKAGFSGQAAKNLPDFPQERSERGVGYVTLRAISR